MWDKKRLCGTIAFVNYMDAPLSLVEIWACAHLRVIISPPPFAFEGQCGTESFKKV